MWATLAWSPLAQQRWAEPRSFRGAAFSAIKCNAPRNRHFGAGYTVGRVASSSRVRVDEVLAPTVRTT